MKRISTIAVFLCAANREEEKLPQPNGKMTSLKSVIGEFFQHHRKFLVKQYGTATKTLEYIQDDRRKKSSYE